MNLLQAILLGILQGLTEFIPVSSTAHLLISQKLLGLGDDPGLFAFTVLVQLGTLASLIVYYWRDIIRIVRAFFDRPLRTSLNRLAWFILIASLPALLAGYLLNDLVEALFRQPLLEAGIRLLLSAALLALAEWLGKRSRALDQMTWLDALIIGFFQVLSVFPGASRSGSTIAGGLLRGLDRPAAARFAFLVSIPVMLAAGGYETLQLVGHPQGSQFLPQILAGAAAAAVAGWLAIRWLLHFLGKHSLYVFSLYCACIGLACLALHFAL